MIIFYSIKVPINSSQNTFDHPMCDTKMTKKINVLILLMIIGLMLSHSELAFAKWHHVFRKASKHKVHHKIASHFVTKADDAARHSRHGLHKFSKTTSHHSKKGSHLFGKVDDHLSHSRSRLHHGKKGSYLTDEVQKKR